MWRETTRQERNRVIWEEELADFVPRRVLDFHVHVFLDGTTGGTPHDVAGNPLPAYTLDDLSDDLDVIYPGRETAAVVFALPYPNHDYAKNNDYLGARCDQKRFFPLRVFDPATDTAEAVHEALQSKQQLGLKPYPNFTRHADLGDAQITEMLPDWAMEAVDAAGALVMLHIPRRKRLEDPLNRKQLRELCERYPRARIVLAHVGRSYYLRGAVGQLDELAGLPNLYPDTAMVQQWEVIEHMLNVFPREQILYGTDVPIALAPGIAVEINNQYTYVTPKPWPLSISDDHGKLRFTSFLYEQLRAWKKAAQRAGLPRAEVEAVFWDNGMRLLNEVTGA